MSTSNELPFLERAIALALAAEKKGNLPIGAVIVLDGEIIGEGGNRIASPQYDPGRHAEIEAIRSVPLEAWPRAWEITCYSTLEPCIMCTGTLLLSRSRACRLRCQRCRWRRWSDSHALARFFRWRGRRSCRGS